MDCFNVNESGSHSTAYNPSSSSNSVLDNEIPQELDQEKKTVKFKDDIDDEVKKEKTETYFKVGNDVKLFSKSEQQEGKKSHKNKRDIEAEEREKMQ